MIISDITMSRIFEDTSKFSGLQGCEFYKALRCDYRKFLQRLRHPARAQHLKRAGMKSAHESAGRPPVDGTVVMSLQGKGQLGRASAGYEDVRPLFHAASASLDQAASSISLIRTLRIQPDLGAKLGANRDGLQATFGPAHSQIRRS
jgi:hypothetical protein